MLRYTCSSSTKLRRILAAVSAPTPWPDSTINAVLPKLFTSDATFHARSNLWFCSGVSLPPVRRFRIILDISSSDQNVALTRRDRQLGHDISSGTSFVSITRSHLPQRMQTSRCFVFSSRSLTSSITPSQYSEAWLQPSLLNVLL